MPPHPAIVEVVLLFARVELYPSCSVQLSRYALLC